MELDLAKYFLFPKDALQYGKVLNISLFLHLPVNKKIVPFRLKGDVLTEAERSILDKHGNDCQVVVLKAEHQSLTAQRSKEMANVLATEGKVTPEVQENAKQLLMESSSPHMMEELPRAIEGILLSLKTLKPSIAVYDKLLSDQGSKKNQPLEHHHRQVSAIASLIWMTIGTPTIDELSDIATAGLIHDIELLHGSKVVLDKYLAGKTGEMNTAERLIFLRHPMAAIDRMKNSKVVLTPAACRIIEFHHQDFGNDGTHPVSGQRLFYPARIFRIADDAVTTMDMLGCESFMIVLGHLHVVNREKKLYDPQILDTLCQKLNASFEVSA